VTRLLGLEIAARELRVARGERSFGTLRLTALERRPLASRAALPGVLGELAQTRADVVLTALPAASATHRFLTLPFRDRGRLARAPRRSSCWGSSRSTRRVSPSRASRSGPRPAGAPCSPPP